MKEFSLIAISDPIADQQKPFVWSEFGCSKTAQHFSQPNKWHFKSIIPTWKLS